VPLTCDDKKSGAHINLNSERKRCLRLFFIICWQQLNFKTMGDYSFDLRPLIWLGAFIILAIWGCWELIDWLWIDDAIRSTKPITPEIELVIKNNVVDTVYVYRKP
jgi:hypothetical protein